MLFLSCFTLHVSLCFLVHQPCGNAAPSAMHALRGKKIAMPYSLESMSPSHSNGLNEETLNGRARVRQALRETKTNSLSVLHHLISAIHFIHKTNFICLNKLLQTLRSIHAAATDAQKFFEDQNGQLNNIVGLEFLRAKWVVSFRFFPSVCCKPNLGVWPMLLQLRQFRIPRGGACGWSF